MKVPPELWPDRPEHERNALYELMQVLVELVVREILDEQTSVQASPDAVGSKRSAAVTVGFDASEPIARLGHHVASK